MVRERSNSSANRLLRIEDVADRLGISKRTVWRLVSAGKLKPPVSIGRCRRWVRADVDEFVDSLKDA